MFLFGQKRPPQAPPPVEHLDSFELKLRLSGPTIVRLVSIVVAVLLGSGVVVKISSDITPAIQSPTIQHNTP